MNEYFLKYQNATIGRNLILLLPSFYTSKHFKAVRLHCSNHDYLSTRWSEATKTAPKAWVSNCVKVQDTNFRRKRQRSSLYPIFYKKQVSSPLLPKKKITSNQNDFQENGPFIYSHFFYVTIKLFFKEKNHLCFCICSQNFCIKTQKLTITGHLI